MSACINMASVSAHEENYVLIECTVHIRLKLSLSPKTDGIPKVLRLFCPTN